jgi:hypothetical protein
MKLCGSAQTQTQSSLEKMYIDTHSRVVRGNILTQFHLLIFIWSFWLYVPDLVPTLEVKKI